MGVAFPDDYSNWQKTDLHDLIDATLIPEPTDKNVVKAVRKLAKEADSVVIATDFDREGELIGHEALQQAMESNPEDRRRADRRAPARQARPLLRAHQGRDRARLLGARRPLLRARLRRRRPPGHRPDLGRHAHPRRLARHAPLRLQLPLGRPRPEPEPRPGRRARARAPRPRAEALLGGLREVRAPRRLVRGASRDRQVLGRGRGERRARRHEEPGRRQGRDRPQELAQAADAAQHHRLHDRRLQPPRHHARQRDADRRGPLHGRLHLLPAYRQHGLSEVAEHARARPADGPDPGVRGRRLRPRRPDGGDPRQEGDDRPPADLSDPGGLSRRPRRGPEAPRLRARRPPLHRDLRAADDHRVDPRQHRGRVGGVLRPRLGRRRRRLREDLHLRPLVRRRDPGARGRPGAAARRRAVVGRQGDAAALADLAGQADRADGGARPGHQGDARRHHPEALRPRLRLLEPADPVRDRDRDVQGLQGVRAAHGDARDDRRARARTWT